MSAHDYYNGREVKMADEADAGLVADYAQRLEAALDALRNEDDETAYPSIVAELENESRSVKIAVALEVTKYRTTSGAEAIQRLERLWSAVYGTWAGIRATGGRSAG